MKSLATLGNELYSGKTSIPFVGRRRVWYLIAVVVIAGSATLLATVGLTPGIDFKGGSEITVTGLSSPSERPANEALAKGDLTAGSSVTTMGSSSVRVQTNQLSKERLDALREEGHELGIVEPGVGVERREHAGAGRGRREDTCTGCVPQLMAPGIGHAEDGAPSPGALVGLEESPFRQALEEVVDGGEGQGGPLAVAALLDDSVEVVAMARLLGKEREENDVGVR